MKGGAGGDWGVGRRKAARSFSSPVDFFPYLVDQNPKLHLSSSHNHRTRSRDVMWESPLEKDRRTHQPRSQGLSSSRQNNRFWREEERPWERGCSVISRVLIRLMWSYFGISSCHGIHVIANLRAISLTWFKFANICVSWSCQSTELYLLYDKLVHDEKEYSDWFPERTEFCNTIWRRTLLFSSLPRRFDRFDQVQKKKEERRKKKEERKSLGPGYLASRSVKIFTYRSYIMC